MSIDSYRPKRFRAENSKHVLRSGHAPATYVLQDVSEMQMDDSNYKEKVQVIETAITKETDPKAYDPEKDGVAPPTRPFLLNHAASVGVAMALVVVIEMACIAKV